MNIIRDLALVVGGAMVALAFQPASAVSNQNVLESHAGELAAIAKVMKVDKKGNIRIKGHTIEIDGGIKLLLKGVRTHIKSEGEALLRSNGIISMNAHTLELDGSGMTMINGRRGVPVARLGSKVRCPGANWSNAEPIICSIISGSATVLVGG